MKTCDHFDCTDLVEDSESIGFEFCNFHADQLLNLADYDKLNDLDFINVIGYCLSSLNSKIYKNTNIVI